jgi:hypothetical protein
VNGGGAPGNGSRGRMIPGGCQHAFGSNIN